MTPDILDLYTEMLLDHSRHPRNFGELESANRTAVGRNPACRDQVVVFLDVEEDTVRRVSFQGEGCAISTASASLMTESVQGKGIAEIDSLFERFRQMLTGPQDQEWGLGKLEVLSGVRQFPGRVKCATLAWHTLRAALAGQPNAASTE